jgi:hypothetical protein
MGLATAITWFWNAVNALFFLDADDDHSELTVLVRRRDPKSGTGDEHEEGEEWEVYPLQVRELGMGLATAITWFWNAVNALFFPLQISESWTIERREKVDADDDHSELTVLVRRRDPKSGTGDEHEALQVRELGMGLATAITWFWNAVNALFFPLQIRSWHEYKEDRAKEKRHQRLVHG